MVTALDAKAAMCKQQPASTDKRAYSGMALHPCRQTMTSADFIYQSVSNMQT